MKFSKLIVAALLPVFYFLFLNSALAENLTVSPVIIEQSVVPGTTYNFSLDVTNNDSSGDNHFFLDTVDVKNVTDFGEPVFSDNPEEKTGFEMASWIQLPSSSVSIKPGQTSKVAFSVSVPSNATPGWHAGSVFVGNNPLSGNKNNSSLIDYKTAVIISLRVAGAVADELQINRFSTGGYILFSPHVDFDVALENTGNALERPVGSIQISDYYGNNVANVDLNSTRRAVVPGSVRSLSSSWQGNEWSFGRYKASLALSYGDENSYKTTARQTYFWVLPGKILFWSILILLSAAVVIYFGTQFYIKRKVDHLTSGRHDHQRIGRVSKLVVMALVSLVFAIIFGIFLFIFFS